MINFRSYFDKVPAEENESVYDQVAKVMLYYFGEEAKGLLMETKEIMIGDFLDPYNFYTVIEPDELKEFMVEKVAEINARIDWKINIIPCTTTLMQVISYDCSL